MAIAMPSCPFGPTICTTGVVTFRLEYPALADDICDNERANAGQIQSVAEVLDFFKAA